MSDSSGTLNLILIDFEPELCAAWREAFADLPRQMALAWLFFVHPPARFDWRTATERQDRLGRGGDFAILPIKPQET